MTQRNQSMLNTTTAKANASNSRRTTEYVNTATSKYTHPHQQAAAIRYTKRHTRRSRAVRTAVIALLTELLDILVLSLIVTAGLGTLLLGFLWEVEAYKRGQFILASIGICFITFLIIDLYGYIRERGRR